MPIACGVTADVTQWTRPISRNGLWNLLRDRYYLGEVDYYEGVTYPGRHEPLTTPETFEKVQRVIASHSGAGTRERSHHHYLKGTVWCGRCGSRFIVQRAAGNGGVYYYFLCRGRQSKTCDQPYVPVEVMEDAVADHYRRAVSLPASYLADLRGLVSEAVATDTSLSAETRAALDKELAKLDQREDYFLDLAADEGWPKDKLAAKLGKIRAEKQRIRTTIDQAEQQLATGRVIVEHALALLERPAELYERHGESVRSILNKAIFSKLYIDADKITGQEHAEPFAALYDPHADVGAGHPKETGPDRDSSPTTTLQHKAHGWSKATMVDDTGIEPVTSSVSG